MNSKTLKTALISLSIFTVASASTLGLAQLAQAPQVATQEAPLYAHNHTESRNDYVDEYDMDHMDFMDVDYYLEDYKEGYRDGFVDGFKAALEELEAMYFEDDFYDEDYGDMYDNDMYDEYGEDAWDENVEFLETAPEGLSPTYLPEGLEFEEAYSFTDEDGIVDEGAFYVDQAAESYLDINRIKLTVEEANELYGEDIMAELSDLPTKEIEGTTVYMEMVAEQDDTYITAYFSKADGLYTVDSNLSEAEMNIILSSLLGQ